MTNNGVEQKPSETALFAALRRTIANKEFANEKFGPDYLAEYFLPPHFRFFLKFEKIRLNTRIKLDGVLPGLTEYMIARTAHFDKLFVEALENKTPQIVLLGAGYDTRAYRYANLNRSTKIFELDIAPTQNRKKKCLKKARVKLPSQVSFVPIDFNNESLADVLERAGYDHRDRTLFIWEGVSYYLEAESVDATLEFVRQTSHAETRIAFDCTVSISDQKLEEYYGVREFVQTMRQQHANEALLFSIDEGQIGSFLEHRSLKLVELMKNNEIEAAYLMSADGKLVGQITAHFRFVLASKQ